MTLYKDAQTGEFLDMVTPWVEGIAWFRTKGNAINSMGEDDVVLATNGGHEEGKAYYIDYWQQYALVTALNNPNGDWYVTYKWQDGHSTTHCTSLGRRDEEVSLEEYESACARYQESRRNRV